MRERLPFRTEHKALGDSSQAFERGVTDRKKHLKTFCSGAEKENKGPVAVIIIINIIVIIAINILTFFF